MNRYIARVIYIGLAFNAIYAAHMVVNPVGVQPSEYIRHVLFAIGVLMIPLKFPADGAPWNMYEAGRFVVDIFATTVAFLAVYDGSALIHVVQHMTSV